MTTVPDGVIRFRLLIWADHTREIWGSHGGEDDDVVLLGCDAL
jgi:hypothetical protein